jgi:6-phosphogluconate dehydrogenase
MGQNLVLNLASHGYSVSVYNRSVSKVDQFLEGPAKGNAGIVGTHSIRDFVESLHSPRKIMLMVKAGAPVDAVIYELLPHLAKGDIVIDGGNSFFKDTIRRTKALEEQGFRFLGVGVSGGEEGALKGPSIMPGGSKEAWEYVGDILTAISAKVDNTPCCSFLGPDGAGHYVKMVHNGIEYADMQLISEAYFLMRELLGMPASGMHQVFEEWNQGDLNSYLIEITADILRKNDAETSRPMVDLVMDHAGQKGTGKWTAQEALELGISVPSIAEAVFARCISAIKDERVVASSELVGPNGSGEYDKVELLEDIQAALYVSKICAYAQGFALLKAASVEYGWDLSFGEIALLWRGGCIIRAQFLNRIRESYISPCFPATCFEIPLGQDRQQPSAKAHQAGPGSSPD